MGGELGGRSRRRDRHHINEVYERYMRYLTGCADFFRRGITEVGQFTSRRDKARVGSIRSERQSYVAPAEAERIGDA